MKWTDIRKCMLGRQTMPADVPPLGKLSSELTRFCLSAFGENVDLKSGEVREEATTVQGWRRAPAGWLHVCGLYHTLRRAMKRVP